MTRSDSERGTSTGKPFPWYCPECGKKQVRLVTVAHTSQVRHDGRVYEVAMPRLQVPQCAACGELVFDNHADDQVASRLREQLGLLSAEQIHDNRTALGLSQQQLAEHLGIAVETISRWENGILTQTRAMDRYLRLYFGVPAARAALLNESSLPSLGEQVVA